MARESILASLSPQERSGVLHSYQRLRLNDEFLLEKVARNTNMRSTAHTLDEVMRKANNEMRGNSILRGVSNVVCRVNLAINNPAGYFLPVVTVIHGVFTGDPEFLLAGWMSGVGIAFIGAVDFLIRSRIDG